MRIDIERVGDDVHSTFQATRPDGKVVPVTVILDAGDAALYAANLAMVCAFSKNDTEDQLQELLESSP